MRYRSYYPIFLLIISLLLVQPSPVHGCSLLAPPPGREHYFKVSTSIYDYTDQLIAEQEFEGGLGADCSVTKRFEPAGENRVLVGSQFYEINSSQGYTLIDNLGEDIYRYHYQNEEWYLVDIYDNTIYYQMDNYQSILVRDLETNEYDAIDLNFQAQVEKIQNESSRYYLNDVVISGATSSLYTILQNDTGNYLLSFDLASQTYDHLYLADFSMFELGETIHLSLNSEQTMLLTAKENSTTSELNFYTIDPIEGISGTYTMTNDYYFPTYRLSTQVGMVGSTLYIIGEEAINSYDISTKEEKSLDHQADEIAVLQDYIIIFDGEITTVWKNDVGISYVFLIAIPVLVVIRRSFNKSRGK